MVKKRCIIAIMVIFSLLPFSYASHYITGVANNALDGNNVNSRMITLWNPENGINDNLTDIVGPTGNSGVNNIYFIDCELLNNGCSVGDVLTLKIFDGGSGYPSESRNVTVTGYGYDLVSNITLNSPPETSLISPSNYGNVSTNINFNCSLEDLDDNLQNVSLWGNWSGGWHLNQTITVNPDADYVDFTKDIAEGTYFYACQVTDNLSVSNFSTSNNTFNVDLTKPVITSVLINQTSTCGYQQVRVNCTATDAFSGTDTFTIQGITWNNTFNYTATFLSGNTYYAEIFLNQTTSWRFNCIVNDSSGNQENLTSSYVESYSSLPDLYINYNSIFLSNENPVENETITINATIENLGCGDVSGETVGFFKNDPHDSGINIGNDTINVLGLSTTEASIQWNAEIGTTNFFIYADYWNSLTEFNETNNKANKSFSINAWQEIYGNVSIERIIGISQGNLERWQNISFFDGNVFLTDSECDIDWVSLQALGRNIGGGVSTNDFSELDSILNMQNFEDSISNEYTISQTPKNTDTFYVHDDNLTNVPIINSTLDSDFITGILWDYSDDLDSDGEYDSADQEDIVFVTKINRAGQGLYGEYDYEISVPARLREYKTADSNEIYLYYDLN